MKIGISIGVAYSWGRYRQSEQGRMIDPRVLRTYLAVCREGSISAAARQLNISQPSVSVAIAQLEQKLGGSLFERGRQGIVLTAAGRALMRRAEMMEVLLLDAEEAVAL